MRKRTIRDEDGTTRRPWKRKRLEVKKKQKENEDEVKKRKVTNNSYAGPGAPLPADQRAGAERGADRPGNGNTMLIVLLILIRTTRR